MITIDLRHEPVTVNELLHWAEQDAIRILAASGRTFILEESDESFEQEVTRLGNSERFMAFLAERSREPADMSLEDFERSIPDEKS
jgi:hypothetical protein